MLLTYFGISNTAAEGIIPDSVKYSFYIGGTAFFIAVFWTVIKSKEYSPKELKAFEKTNQKEENQLNEVNHNESWYITNGKSHLKLGVIILIIGLFLTYLIYHFNLKKDLFVLSLGLISFGGLALIISGFLQTKSNYKIGFITIMNDLQNMPKVMKQLAWVQFFSWFALFSMWIYTTAAVTEHIYKTTDTTSVAYNTGANQVGEMFANYNLIAAIVAFLLPVIARKTSRKFTHFLALVLGGLGLISIYFITNPTTFNLEWLPMIGIGIAWASILSIPYAMLSGSLPAAKMGYFMGVFNYFIVIPQLVAASILGFIVSRFFDNQPIYALFIGGASMIIAGLLSLRVDDKTNTNE
jgi:maltose/moltooligosaccharide transporter